MRYDTPIYFQSVKQGEYDIDTGNYGNETIEEAKRYASVQDTSMQTLNIVYGDIRQESKTISLQIPYCEAFDRIRIGSRLYKVDGMSSHLTKQSFIVSEVP